MDLNKAHASEAPWKQYSVLAVDDEPGMVSFLQRALTLRCGVVDTAGFLASTLDVSDAAFLRDGDREVAEADHPDQHVEARPRRHHQRRDRQRTDDEDRPEHRVTEISGIGVFQPHHQ